MDPHTSTIGRESCWISRDAFYACVDKHVGDKALDSTSSVPNKHLDEAKDTCAALRKEYDAKCMLSWRSYWDDRFSKGRPILGRKQ